MSTATSSLTTTNKTPKWMSFKQWEKHLLVTKSLKQTEVTRSFATEMISEDTLTSPENLNGNNVWRYLNISNPQKSLWKPHQKREYQNIYKPLQQTEVFHNITSLEPWSNTRATWLTKETQLQSTKLHLTIKITLVSYFPWTSWAHIVACKQLNSFSCMSLAPHTWLEMQLARNPKC